MKPTDTPPIFALSLSEDFHNRLLDKRPLLKVHSVFERVVNLVDDVRGLWTIAARSCDNAPRTMRVGLPHFLDCFVSEATPVFLQAGHLHLGDFSLAYEGAPLWNPALPAWQTPPFLAARLLKMQATIFEKQSTGHDGLWEKAVHHKLTQETSFLLKALQGNKEDEAIRAACDVLGLGPGLTPSGDDFLLGFFAVLHLVENPANHWQKIGAPLLEVAKTRTNQISYAALEQAVLGRFRAKISHFLFALFLENERDFETRFAALLDIGASSGADIGAGLLFGLRFLSNLDQK